MANRKTVIVTGASQGIGAAIVQAFLDRSYNVVATSRSVSKAGFAPSPNLALVDGDISQAATAEKVTQTAITKFGSIDHVVNNAGIFAVKPFTDYTSADFTAMIATNLAGFFHITQRAAAEMLKQGGGHIVNITTSFVDHPFAAVPAALANLTKGGIASATKALAIEYAARGIRVNAVSPGFIKTPIIAPENYEFLAGLVPVKHIGEIRDIVEAVLYLETAGFVTGAILHVDGGQNAGH